MRWRIEWDTDGNPTCMRPVWGLAASDVGLEQFITAHRLVWIAQQRGMGGRRVLAIPNLYDWFRLD